MDDPKPKLWLSWFTRTPSGDVVDEWCCDYDTPGLPEREQLLRALSNGPGSSHYGVRLFVGDAVAPRPARDSNPTAQIWWLNPEHHDVWHTLAQRYYRAYMLGKNA